MPMGGLISAGRDRCVAGAANADSIGGVGGADQTNYGITGLVVQFLKGWGFHDQAPIWSRGFDPARLLGRDQKNDLAHS
jgi:hypothetical protein